MPRKRIAECNIEMNLHMWPTSKLSRFKSIIQVDSELSNPTWTVPKEIYVSISWPIGITFCHSIASGTPFQRPGFYLMKSLISRVQTWNVQSQRLHSCQSRIWSSLGDLVVSSFLFPQLCKPSRLHLAGLWRPVLAMEPTGCASLSSHHHPVCLPSPWQIAGNLKRRNCRIGSVFSTGLKQCHPSKFQCIKRVCDQANYPLGWRECTRYKCLNASARVKCCCASKSRGEKKKRFGEIGQCLPHASKSNRWQAFRSMGSNSTFQ